MKQKWGQHPVNKNNISLLFLGYHSIYYKFYRGLGNLSQNTYLETTENSVNPKVESRKSAHDYIIPSSHSPMAIYMSYHTLTTATVSLVKPLVKAVTATIHYLSLFTAPGPRYLGI